MGEQSSTPEPVRERDSPSLEGGTVFPEGSSAARANDGETHEHIVRDGEGLARGHRSSAVALRPSLFGLRRLLGVERLGELVLVRRRGLDGRLGGGRNFVIGPREVGHGRLGLALHEGGLDLSNRTVDVGWTSHRTIFYV